MLSESFAPVPAASRKATRLTYPAARRSPDARSERKFHASLGYFAGTDPDDPLIAPVKHPDVLARFPPTLLITGTRDFALSNTLHTNIELTKAGVETRLYVWDGLFHGFFYNPNVPESQDAYRIIVRFFSQQLGSAH